MMARKPLRQSFLLTPRLCDPGRPRIFEQLEPRWLLASVWQNPVNPLDANNDGEVSPADVMLISNKINSDGAGPLSISDPFAFYDVNGNKSVEPGDILAVINAMHRGLSANSLAGEAGSGEVTVTTPSSSVRGQVLEFTFSTQQAGELDYEVDWDADGRVDEAIRGPATELKVQHVYKEAGAYTLLVTARNESSGYTGGGQATLTIGVVELQGDDLVVGGSPGDDRILFLQRSSGLVSVLVNRERWTGFAVPGKLVVFGQQGRDVVLAAQVDLPTELHGQEGNDLLFGGKGPDRMFGGPGDDRLFGRGGDDLLDGGGGGDRLFGYGGDDVLRGGAGPDHIFGQDGNDIILGGSEADALLGSRGRDLLIGGADSDKLFGNSQDDILIAGTTLHDSNQGALQAVMNEWTSEREFDDRVENLIRGVGDADVALKAEGAGATVFDDGSRDDLIGGSDRDWLLAGEDDRVLGKQSSDRVDTTSQRPGDPPLDPESSNIAITTDPGVQQNPSISVNPLDADHVVVAYMDYSLVDTGFAGIGVSVSLDGGETWQASQVPIPEQYNQGASNPTVRFDDQGRVFVSFQAVTFLDGMPGLTNPTVKPGEFPRAYGMRANNGIFVVRSDDGGLHWQQATSVVSHLYDGGNGVFLETFPAFAIDDFPTLPGGKPNPHYGNMYVAWTRSYPEGQFPGEPDSTGGTDAMVAVSEDGGETWEVQMEERGGALRTVIQLEEAFDPNSGIGSAPGFGFMEDVRVNVGPEGEVYVSHFGGGNHAMNVSRDGGASFNEPSIFTGNQIVFGTGFSTFVNSDGLPGNEFRTRLSRAIAADPTRPGTVYAAEMISVVGVTGEEFDPADVFFGHSDDYGATWDTTFMVGPHPDLSSEETVADGFKVPVNDDNQARSAANSSPLEVTSGQALVRLVTDAQGRVGLIWYDTRRDPDNIKLDVFGAISSDGGQTFTANFRITDISFDAHDGSFTNAVGEEDFYIGDFLGLAMANNVAYAAWTDTRNGNQDIFVGIFDPDTPPEPLNDRFEPNDTPDLNSSPTVLGRVVRRVLPKLTLEPGDQDYFLFETAATGELVAQVRVDDRPLSNSNSLQLELYDELGQTLLETGSPVFDSDGNLVAREIRFATAADRSFQVRVFGETQNAAQYTLDLQSLTRDLGPRAYTLVEGSVSPDAELYYLVAAAATGSMEVALATGPNVVGSLNLALRDPLTLELLETGQPESSSRQRATVQVRKGDELIVRVTGQSSATGDFTLEFFNRDRFTDEGRKTLFYPVGAGTSQATLHDVNRDGDLDAIVTSAVDDQVSVLLGTGDGTFQAPRIFKVGAFQTAATDVTARVPTFGRDVAVADFDNDENPDLVVNNFASSDISVLLGRGDGTFEFQRRYEATPAPFDLDVGDVNNDGHFDIVAIETALGKLEVALSVLLGRGDGTFLPEETTTVPIGGNNNGTVRLHDLDGDGNLDAVVSGDGLSAEVSVFLGRGDGTFTFSTNLSASRLAVGLDIGDLNGDGLPDIVNSGLGSLVDVAILLQTPDRTFSAPITVATPIFTTGLRIADFGSEVTLPDGSTTLGPPDGTQDILIAAAGVPATSGPTGEPALVVFPGVIDAQGNYGVGARHNIMGLEQPRDVDVGDVNNDGLPDVLLTEPDGVVVVFGEPPQIPRNDSIQTARDLGTTVHLVDQTQTIIPGREAAFYKFTVPTEAVGSMDEVIDVSLLFEHPDGSGIDAELRDAQGNLLGSGRRFRIRARQGEVLTLHIFSVAGGAGAFTPIINVLPQVVSVEAQAFLPGVGGNPGGPTTSIVVTLQGDRLDPSTAENLANYSVTNFGPDRLFGTADDVLIEIKAVVYSPGTNVEVSSGRTFPTAVRQTVTLATDQALPDGSYRVDLSEDIRTADFNDQEAELLADTALIAGHPVVSLADGQIAVGSRQSVPDLVLPSGSVGDISVFNTGTGFLTQLHADMSAILDATLSEIGDDPQVTIDLTNLMRDRLVPTVGASGQRIASIIAVWLDPVDLDFENDSERVIYDQDEGIVTNEIDECFIEVGGNIEIIVCALLDDTDESFKLTVGRVSESSRGGAIQITEDDVEPTDLTTGMQSGQTVFDFPF